ncbi:MAG: nicotinate-nucleotide adenylyltransferase [Bacteroidia bacterium]|nr:nicotinate-nucleotide adenylyltransferase [Bacteroidia bacterium]NND51417.1 nicotinate-nucleotide adenylyltransferase [Flavobacteriaceae bacterium]
MKKLILGLLFFGFATHMFAQVITLSEVRIAVNYKYLDAVDNMEAAIPVQMLEDKVGLYDITKSELYSDEYDTYTISFYIPDGKIVAVFDQNGEILRTVEKFKDVKLPDDVVKAVVKRFPNWSIVSDVYRVNYHHKKEIARKQYKITLKNGDEIIKVKVDPNGNFM